MTALLVADHDGQAVQDATARALTAALALGGPVDVLVAGAGARKAAEAAARLAGVRAVLLADDPAYEHRLPEALAPLVAAMAGDYAAILLPASSSGRDVAPRIAALLDVAQVSSIQRVISPTVFERPIYAGNVLEVVEVTDPKAVITVRTSSFPTAGEGGAAPVTAVAVPPAPSRVTFRNKVSSRTDRPELGSARTVVSGGRALGSAERFMELLAPIADHLGAALGASRAAVDAGYAPNDWQVGQTGKIVAPDLYIAAGISGAIQHLAGMKDAKVIVAINMDSDAPIFQIADYGLVADINDALPELAAALASARPAN